jgi:putative membrane protein insertion efficiency factor
MKQLVIGSIRLYQKTVSPDHGWFKSNKPTCRFSPSCSEYMVTAITRHGIITGVGLGFKRISRCHPFHAGGFDPVPEKQDIS